ncbi:hypothetical protein QWY92_07975 [Algibacter miyuki]|uniref:hypothetical protein n=1 Tax=Algibacter miyuki TaxID=1306933 RepID=UPI0025B56455|nr:hypothetical protein [Algibacter miyuki]MDN3665347.1 hypothetical protein [Algibacter miyuki]
MTVTDNGDGTSTITDGTTTVIVSDGAEGPQGPAGVVDPKDLTADDTTIVVTGGAGATLIDASLKVGTESITTTHIQNGTIAPEDIANAGNDQVLVTSSTGVPTWVDQSSLEIEADNGLTKTDNKIQLGGALIKPTTITTGASNTLAVAGLVAQTGADLDNVDGIMTVEADGTVRKVYPVYSATAAQNTLKKWIDNSTVYERVGSVTLSTNTNIVSLSGVVPSGAKLLGVRLINQTTNSISTNIIEYNSSTGQLILGTAGSLTTLHPAGSYHVIVEYVE